MVSSAHSPHVAATVRSIADVLRETYSESAMRRVVSPTPEERAEDAAKHRAKLLARPPLTDAHADPPELYIRAEVEGECLDIRCVRVGQGKYIPNLDDLREYVEGALQRELSWRADCVESDREERKRLEAP